MTCINKYCVSIVVVVRNEEKNIESSLKRLVGQTYPGDKYEVIVVDGMSNDGTRDIVKELIRTQHRKIRFVDNSTGRRASGLNIGIRQAKGDIIVRVDARTVLPADYIEKCVNTLVMTGADNVGGVQRPIINETLRFHSVGGKRREKESGEGPEECLPDRPGSKLLTQAAIGGAMSHPFGVGNAQFRLGKRSGPVDSVYLGCFRKEIFQKVGLFDDEAPIITEDSDINYRIRKAGGKVYLNKDIIAYYHPRDSFEDLYKLYFRYGGARAGFLIKHKKLTSWRQLVAPAFLVVNVMLPVLSIFDKTLLLFWLVLLGIYTTTDIVVSTYLAHKPAFIIKAGFKRSLFWRFIITFPIMHCAWALGFWKRVLQNPKPGTYWEY